MPRLINLVCDTALVYGYGEEAPTISVALVEQVLRDKEMGFSPVGNRRRQWPEREQPTKRPPSKRSKTANLSTVERAAARLRKGH